MRKYKINEIKTIDLMGSLECLSKTLLSGNTFDTIFVIDSKQHLHGIITRGDFLRKAGELKNIESIMNKKHVRIENKPGEEKLFEQANDIFNKHPRINEIPVTDATGKLLYVIKRNGLRKYGFETIEGILKLRNEEQVRKLLDIFKNVMDIKRIGIILEDELLEALSDILTGCMDVHVYKTYEELSNDVDINKELDLILMHDVNSLKNIIISNHEPILLDCEVLNHLLYDDEILNIKNLKNTKGRKFRKCACCERRSFFKPLPSRYALQGKKYGMAPCANETLNEEEYKCIYCGISDRGRLIVAFLRRLGIIGAKKELKLLHIAPEKAIEDWIVNNCPKIRYESTDLFMDGVTFKTDIQNMIDVKDETYDLFICSHVLEHVKDDGKALGELKRILKKDGLGIFLVPVCLDMEGIDEEWGLSEGENWRRFGQNDHCRRYGKKGLLERLQNSGFYIHSLGKDFFGEELYMENAFTDTSTLYILSKMKGDIQDLLDKQSNII